MRCPGHRALVLACGLLATSPALAQSSMANETSQQDTEASASQSILLPQVTSRGFGHTIGDRLEQHILLPADTSLPDITDLAQTRRISQWLERQKASLHARRDGRQELRIRYQIINAPTVISQAALPELQLLTGDATDSQDAVWFVPAWPFTLGPLTITGNGLVASSEDGMTVPAIRADHAPQLADLAPMLQRLQWTLSLLAAVLMAGFGWYLWRHYRDRTVLPFARALHRIRTLQRRSPGTDGGDEAWQLLHEAFNQSAGQSIARHNQHRLHESQPWLEPLHPRISEFFDASYARHFEVPARDPSMSLTELAQVLANQERRHSR